MKVGIITQARMTSTRLPGKVMLTAAGRPLLDIHLDRLSATDLPVIVATTTNAADDPIAGLAGSRGLTVFRGSEEDVLGRFAGAADEAGLDAVVRVTSDCPLLDPEVIGDAVRLFTELNDPDAYVSNVIERTYPRGLDVEVFSAAALADADASATDPSDREHVTPYLYANRSGRTTLRSITRTPDASRHRITLDTADDLTVIRRLIEDHDAARLDAAGLVAVLDAHPELTAINAHVEQKKLGG
ncbi:acylneuraminate cytidylyltransferase [Microbacterium sp. SZ1]|uniref:cytidylyltransferase domain-containing protein n=1 Tax=Microbacterium sp. SZ1 TaxID=1849736 RepID=UPI000BBC82D6|nr:glycosyltransferase family protein [Microbacterium sp. SZ1]PCE14941.1 acylneuraminate cytidylyltransferase [Microbacterium sp. SZ1]